MRAVQKRRSAGSDKCSRRSAGLVAMWKLVVLAVHSLQG
jgi:hypothetical protein